MAINLNHQLSTLTTHNQILQIDNTGNLILPSGTSAQRNPLSGVNAKGSIRHNDNLCTLEYYDTSWHIIPQTIPDLEDFCFIDPVNVTKHIIYNTTSCCFELADYVTNLTVTNTLDVCGDLTVYGANTNIKSSNLNIADINFTVASDVSNITQTDGAGFNISCANACFYYNQPNDTWNLNKNLVVSYVCGQISDIGNHDTDALAEGSTNLYYLDCRARQSICGGTGVTYSNASGVISIGQDVSCTSNVTFCDVNVSGRLLSDDVTASNVYICGNLTVTGTTTTVNSTTVDIADKNLTLACDAVNGAQADGAGLTICGANACFYWSCVTDTWNLNKNLNVSLICGQVSDISNHYTCDVAECGNLYYTDTRARQSICGGTGVTYCNANGEISIGQDVSTTSCVCFDTVTANYGYYDTCLDITGKLVLRCLIDQGTPAQTDKYLVGYNASECLWKAMPFCCFYNVDDPIAYAIAFSN